MTNWEITEESQTRDDEACGRRDRKEETGDSMV
jgi:hypothetical protein